MDELCVGVALDVVLEEVLNVGPVATFVVEVQELLLAEGE